MVHLIGFDTEEELKELTGKTHDELWDLGYNLDDWDIGFQSDTKLHREPTKEEIENGWYREGEKIFSHELPLWWLMMHISNYCVGPSYVYLDGKHYYLVHHS